MKHPERRLRHLTGREYACLGIALALLAFGGKRTAIAAAPEADTTQPEATQEIEVTGAQPGPRLWRVSKGDHVLWLLGTLDPLPRKMVWKSREVESVLGEVQAVIPTNPSVNVHANPFTWIRLYFQWRGVQVLDGKARLQDVLPPGLYPRVATLVARYDAGDHRIERLKPIFAALRLYRQALDFAHLAPGNEAQDEVVKMARRRNVPIRQSKLDIDQPRDLVAQLGQIPQEAQVRCLEAVVERLETGMEPMKEEAAAWARGDVAALRELMVPKTLDVCTAVVSTSSSRTKALIDTSNAGWEHEVDVALATNRATLALKPIHELIAPRGGLAMLKAKGYMVEGP